MELIYVFRRRIQRYIDFSFRLKIIITLIGNFIPDNKIRARVDLSFDEHLPG